MSPARHRPVRRYSVVSFRVLRFAGARLAGTVLRKVHFLDYGFVGNATVVSSRTQEIHDGGAAELDVAVVISYITY
jgi:hypothetical protein